MVKVIVNHLWRPNDYPFPSYHFVEAHAVLIYTANQFASTLENTPAVNIPNNMIGDLYVYAV